MKKILLAVDGSEQSLTTVEYAAKMLSPEKTEIVLYHVLSKIPEAYWDLEQRTGYDSLMEKLKAYESEHSVKMKDLMAEARVKLVNLGFRGNHVHVVIQERKKGIARDIISESRRGYEILMLGRMGLARQKDPTLGSVAAKVIGAQPDIHICVVTGAPEMSKGIVALDGSKGSMRAIDFIGSLMNGQDFQVTLFHAMRRLGYSTMNSDYNHGMLEIEKLIWAEDKKMIEPVMEEAKNNLVLTGFKPDKIIAKIVTGVASRAAALIEEAKNNNIGSIFVGRTGVSQVEEFNIGRVTNKVIHRATDMAVWIVA